VDDSIVDGTQTVSFTAAAASYSSGSSTVSVLDNDVLALTFSTTKSTISEGDGANAAVGTVTRNNADLSSDLVVTLSSTDTTEVSVSESVTIPAGQASATFAIRAIEDAIVDGTQSSLIEVASPGYVSGTGIIQVTDNDLLSLTLLINKNSIAENAGANAATATVMRNGLDFSSALLVTITGDDSSEATAPATVVIPAGSAAVTFSIDAVDDLLVDGTKTVTFTVAATGYESASNTVNVTDNDSLRLAVTLNKSSVAENAGVNAAIGTVTRNTEDLSTSLLVTLTS
ncbi:MAG: hypothetical protein JNL58_31420, partial [Planctomyces sp.]|nr:hypothetical protein [Planctomyces sp.]